MKTYTQLQMMNKKYDVVLVTQDIFMVSSSEDPFVKNVLLEDQLLENALMDEGVSVFRTHWDDTEFDWSSTRSVLFRATWDYFHRFPEFERWLKMVKDKTQLINPYEQIIWNIDKHYLLELAAKGVNIVPSYFIEAGDKRTLQEVVADSGWEHLILKPAISGGARHTYKFNQNETAKLEDQFQSLIMEEAMMLQPFMKNIPLRGEVSYMVYGGKYSHAVLKKAKAGDFRVQDDWGGTVHDYSPTPDEIAFAESCAANCSPLPVYARVDVTWDNNDQPALVEMEMIEPELWFRKNDASSFLLAAAVKTYLQHA